MVNSAKHTPLGKMRWQFVCGADLASRAIAWYGEGYGGYSHVDAMLPNGSLLGARSDIITIGDRTYGKGVQVRPPEYERWIRRCVVELSCSVDEAARWQTWLTEEIDEPYDQDAILGFLLGKREHAKGHWICSALQTGGLQAVRRLPTLASPPSQITPNALLNIITAIGGQITVRRNA